MTNVPMSAVVLAAYQLQDVFQTSGMPRWAETERFDIDARAPEGVSVSFSPSNAALPAMLRAMLAERSQLRTHRDTKEMPVYLMEMSRNDGRLGPNLKRVTRDCPARPSAAPGAPPAGPDAPGLCGLRGRAGFLEGGAISITQLVDMMVAPRMRRPVLDRTGLQGTYDVSLEFEVEPQPSGPEQAPSASNLSSAPTFVTAMQEQLGLKLRAARAPVEVLIIDTLERPSPD
jgi:uncharacterized protein (TIGR03435 family)